MGFKSVFDSHQAMTSRQNKELSLRKTQEQVERTTNLHKLISNLSPFISPLIERYAAEAIGEGFHAESYFKEEQERCWWAFSFLPTKGDKTLTDPITRGNLDFCAILRVHCDGRSSFEIGVPAKFEKQFGRKDFVRVMDANEVNEQMVASWLDSFIAKSFEVASAHARQ